LKDAVLSAFRGRGEREMANEKEDSEEGCWGEFTVLHAMDYLK